MWFPWWVTVADVSTNDSEEIGVDPARVRRAPRFGRFGFLGGLLGLIVAVALTPFARFNVAGATLDVWGLGLLLAMIAVPIGVLLGAVVALWLDRRSRRRMPR